MSRKKKNQQGKQSDLTIAKLAVLAVKLCQYIKRQESRKANKPVHFPWTGP